MTMTGRKTSQKVAFPSNNAKLGSVLHFLTASVAGFIILIFLLRRKEVGDL